VVLQNKQQARPGVMYTAALFFADMVVVGGWLGYQRLCVPKKPFGTEQFVDSTTVEITLS